MTNEIKAARDALDDFNMRKKSGFDLTGMGQWVWMHEKTILKALSAYEKLQGVDLDGLEESIIKYRNQSGYTISGIDAQRFFYVAQIVADIKKENENGHMA